MIAGLIFAVSFLLLTFRLGSVSLHPWDEAWYASISRNMARTGNLLDLRFNGAPFWDHPPLGFWLQAGSFSIFGVSEFSARLPMAAIGAITAVLLYFTGKKLKSSSLGLAASLILLSSRWWLMRARSGNLDALLLLTQLWVFYLSLEVKTKNNLYRLWFFYGVSFLSKSFISATMFPLVAIASYGFIRDKKGRLKTAMSSLFWFFLPILPWYWFNFAKYGWMFLVRNIWVIGLREMSGKGVNGESVTRTLLYLRSAIHRWYRPAILAISLGGLLSVKNKPVGWVLGYLLLTIFPYFLSAESQIWHLIPAIAPLALLIPIVASEIGEIVFFKNFDKLILALVIAISVWSIKDYWKDIIFLPATVSHEAILAKEASKSDLPLYLQDDTYRPTVIFYADKQIRSVNGVGKQYIEEIKPPFQIITRRFMLGGVKNYKEIARTGESVLVEFK